VAAERSSYLACVGIAEAGVLFLPFSSSGALCLFCLITPCHGDGGAWEVSSGGGSFHGGRACWRVYSLFLLATARLATAAVTAWALGHWCLRAAG